MVNSTDCKKPITCLDVHRWTEQILDNLSSNNSGIARVWANFLPCCEACTCAYYSVEYV